MLEHYLNLSDEISSILIRLAGDSVPKLLVREEISVAIDLMTLLKPFHHPTNIIGGETYFTGNKALPLIMN